MLLFYYKLIFSWVMSKGEYVVSTEIHSNVQLAKNIVEIIRPKPMERKNMHELSSF